SRTRRHQGLNLRQGHRATGFPERGAAERARAQRGAGPPSAGGGSAGTVAGGVPAGASAGVGAAWPSTPGAGARPRATRTPRAFIQASNSSAVIRRPFWFMSNRHGVLSNSVLGL